MAATVSARAKRVCAGLALLASLALPAAAQTDPVPAELSNSMIRIAYLPSKKVLGISKLSRLAKLLARRPVLQEELTQDLAEVLHTRLQSRGSAAYVEGCQK